MKIEASLQEILELMERPAFCVEAGAVAAANQAALDLGIRPGMDVSTLIRTGSDEYQSYTGGTLFLTVQAGGQVLSARVTMLGGRQLFALAQEDTDPQLNAFGLAAQELRTPMNHVMAYFDWLMPGVEDSMEPEQANQLQRMNRGLYQLHRLINNMSDAATAGVSQVELRDLTALMHDIMDHAIPLCEEAGVQISFENHPVSVYSLADAQKLERAVYNLLSNAIGHAPAGSRIAVRFARRGASAQIIVFNELQENHGLLGPGAFDQYLRTPGLGHERQGLGLGMTLVRAVAAAHQGALLFQQVSGGLEAVLNLPIRQDIRELRTPTIRIDYAGERDHGLIELSEFLPPKFYTTKR